MALINAASRPLILAGHGVMLSGAEREILALAERAQIPIAVTLLGIGGVPASHPLNLGMMGMHGEAWVNMAIQQADLLIALGMRFDDRVTGNLKTYAPTARKIHVDIDRAELNKNVRVDVAIASDLRSAIADWLPDVEPGDRSAWLAEIDALKGDSAVRDIQNLPDDGHLYAAHVINDLWRLTDGRAVVVTDVGQHQMWEAQYYKHDAPRSLITSGGLGTMGFALPAAIGAKIARPDAEVWVVVGDGGFQMTMCELATIAQEGLDINVAIINNGYLGMVRQWQEFFYERRYAATPITGPDFVKLAEAFGLWGTAVHRARRRRGGGRRRARAAAGRGDHRFPRRAGRHRVSDGAGRRRSAQDDSPAVAHRRNRSGSSGGYMQPGNMLHTFAVYVDNKPGVLTRVASLFRRRAFNIESLTVGHTERAGVSRMTVVVDTDDYGARRLEANLYKLVPVRRVDDITQTPSIARDLALIKVAATGEGAHPRHAARRRLPRADRRRRPRVAGHRGDRTRGQDRQPGRSAAAVRRHRDGAHRTRLDGARHGRGASAPTAAPATRSRRRRPQQLLGLTGWLAAG